MTLDDRSMTLFHSRLDIFMSIDHSVDRYSLTHAETMEVLDGIRDTLVRSEGQRIRANAAARRRRAARRGARASSP